MSAIDIEAVRADTPGCREIVHLNNAGSALPTEAVLSASIDYLQAEARMGGYEAATSRATDLDRVYDAGALLLGCRPSELAFMPNGTHAWAAALGSVRLEAGDRVLVSSSEYVSSVYQFIGLRERGVTVELIGDDPTGQVSLTALERQLDQRVKLVCATHVPTGGGVVNPVTEIGRLVNAAGALYLLDATQSVGQMALAVDEVGCDFLTVVGRKFLRGPRGSGLLYVRSGIDTDALVDPPVMDGRSAQWVSDWGYRPSDGARRYETFEASMAAKAGLGVAIEYALRIGLDSISKRINDLADALRARLQATPLVRLAEPGGPQSGIVTFAVEGRSSEAVAATLRAWGVNMSVVEALPPAFDPLRRVSSSLVRASVHYYNTEEELDLVVAAL